ncbi:MAG: hypothetical protein CMA10_02720 [Euryarchaeota archaeon]|nr:hypothetical protein [Euryarchaeota archaeon]|tara:strand:- start:4036 stop:4875 length:840 start_codon:yes stop_codon:yes gene_type:complete
MKATTQSPALVLFLVDGSHSTGVSWMTDSQQGTEESIASTLETAVNRALHDLVVNVCYQESEICNRISLGLYVAQEDSVSWGLEEDEPESGWLPSDQWATLAQQDGGSPQWFNLEPKGKTPLLKGWNRMYAILSEFYAKFPQSSAMLITLTDGSFEELNFDEEAIDELVELQHTTVGERSFVHLLAHISADGDEPLVFPVERPSEDVSSMLYDLSTPLPGHMFEGSQTPTLGGVSLSPESRSYIHNADPVLLSDMIQLGSRVVDGNGPRPLPIPVFEEE